MILNFLATRLKKDHPIFHDSETKPHPKVAAVLVLSRIDPADASIIVIGDVEIAFGIDGD